MAADGTVGEGEVKLFRNLGEALDLAPAIVDELLRVWVGPASGAAPPDAREPRLAALELPPDVRLDRATVERALRRMEDLYAEEKFRLLAPELRDMAARRLSSARRSAEELLHELPPPPPAPEPAAPGTVAAGTVRRENPDLDGIFG
jgi:hypothetical protein